MMMEVMGTNSLHCIQHERLVVLLAVGLTAREEMNHRHAQCVNVNSGSPHSFGKYFGSVVANTIYA